MKKATTKEEREKIVADALGCGSDCSMCCACGGMEIDYQQYIDGKKEVEKQGICVNSDIWEFLQSLIPQNQKNLENAEWLMR
ncbi:MAG: hypothetical protein II032_05910 [Treponema sp.]|nr:hypothetical protein [Treponema sp.]